MPIKLVLFNKSDNVIIDFLEETSTLTGLNPDYETIEFECNGDETNLSEIVGSLDSVKLNRVSDLWDACSAYQTNILDATGFVKMQNLADQGLEKSIANVTWLETVWADYYTRKAQIMGGLIVSNDFSNNGELPYNFYDAYFESSE